jgi:hypothetical protein
MYNAQIKLQPYPLQNFHSQDQHITSEKLVTGPVFSTAKCKISLLLEVLADSCGSQTAILKGFQEIYKTLLEESDECLSMHRR